MENKKKKNLTQKNKRKEAILGRKKRRRNLVKDMDDKKIAHLIIIFKKMTRSCEDKKP